jgi:hypothetical protein
LPFPTTTAAAAARSPTAEREPRRAQSQERRTVMKRACAFDPEALRVIAG